MEFKNCTIEKVSYSDRDYPELLKTIKNPPQKLYYKGNLSICNTPCLAVVGARKSTPYGKWAAYNIAKRAAEHGVTIVSGMAAGIDACGHMGALDAGGKTIAVLGCGPDICYPRTNKDLMARINEHGLIISEYSPGQGPLSWQFPARNRIISGLSYGVLVVEAGVESGSLITAGFALDQGKEVFAVPGNIDNIFSAGTNKLIQDGAVPLTEIDDILALLGIENIKKSNKSGFLNLGSDEKNVLTLVEENGVVTMDRLCILANKSPASIGAIVTILEMKGKLHVAMGKIHVAK